MKLEHHMKRISQVGFFAIVFALVASARSAGVGWLEFPVSINGSPGSFIDASSIGFDPTIQQDVTSPHLFLVAPVGLYQIRKLPSGIITLVQITSSDQVEDFSRFGARSAFGIRYFISTALISDNPAATQDSKYLSQKAPSVFLTSQAFFTCSNTTLSSPLQGGTGGNNQFLAEVDARFCPDGSPPSAAQAQYTHGIN